MLNVFDVADDAVGAANLHSSVVLRATGARRVEQRRTQRSDHQEPYPHSTWTAHQIPINEESRDFQIDLAGLIYRSSL